MSEPARPTPRPAPSGPGPAPQVGASLLADAAREAVREVLPAEWQHLPDGTDTGNLLAGVLANHYAAQQQAQTERLTAAAAAAALADAVVEDEVDGYG